FRALRVFRWLSVFRGGNVRWITTCMCRGRVPAFPLGINDVEVLMRLLKVTASAALLALAAGACGENPVSPRLASSSPSLQKESPRGTGLAIDIEPNVTLPLGLGGPITIDQVVFTHLALVENTVGEIVGLQVTGTLSGTAVNVLGKTISVI